MESDYRKIFWITCWQLSLLIMMFTGTVQAQKASDAQFEAFKIKIPVYQEGRDIPILILSSAKAKPIGVRFEMKGVKLVWLGETMEDIKGTVETPVAVYDQSSKTVAGNEKISYRSPEVDISGVGFDIDQEKQTLHIRSKVEVVIKGDLSSAKQLRQVKKKPTKGGKLSLIPTTKEGMEESKKDKNKSSLKNLLQDIQVNKQKVKEKK